MWRKTWLEQNNINVKSREIAVNPCEEKYFISSQKEAGVLEESWWKQSSLYLWDLALVEEGHSKGIIIGAGLLPGGRREPARDATFSLQASAWERYK